MFWAIGYIVVGIGTLVTTRSPYDDTSVKWATFMLWPIVWLINSIKLTGYLIEGIIEIAKE